MEPPIVSRAGVPFMSLSKKDGKDLDAIVYNMDDLNEF